MGFIKTHFAHGDHSAKKVVLLGTQKYHFLGRVVPMGEVSLDKTHMDRLQKVALDILGERVQISH